MNAGSEADNNDVKGQNKDPEKALKVQAMREAVYK